MWQAVLQLEVAQGDDALLEIQVDANEEGALEGETLLLITVAARTLLAGPRTPLPSPALTQFITPSWQALQIHCCQPSRSQGRR